MVVEGADGLYLITNSHVVGIGKTVSLEFKNGTENKDFKKLPVLYQDDKADIALLKLPGDKGWIAPLAFSETASNDGDEVWSAGFPGLSGLPSWQIGQGIVSNSALSIPVSEIIYIQHTAQVDRGSSGGPLLVKNGNDYEIVGLNTLKVFERDGVNLAIPSSALKQAIENAGSANGVSDVQAFLTAIDTMSVNEYASIFDRVPDSVVNRQKEMFKKGDYLEGLALVVDYASENTVSKRNKHKTSRIKSAVQRENLKGIDRDYGFFYKPTIEAALWDFSKGVSVNVCTNHMLGYQYFIGGISLGFVHIKNSPEDNSDEPTQFGWYYTDDGQNLSGFLGQVHAGAQVPIGVHRVEFVPYIIPNVGFGGSRRQGRIYAAYGFKLGMDVEFPADNSVAFVAGLGYSFKRFAFIDDMFDGHEKLNANGLSVSIGMRF